MGFHVVCCENTASKGGLGLALFLISSGKENFEVCPSFSSWWEALPFFAVVVKDTRFEDEGEGLINDLDGG